MQATSLHRCPSEGYSNTITWLCNLLSIDRRTATHLFWEKCFRIGTDRHHWIDTEYARLFIDAFTTQPKN